MECVASVHYVQRWPDTPPERMGATPLAFDGERWFPCEGVRGWHALVQAYGIDFGRMEEREAAMAAFDALLRCQRVGGSILRVAEQAAALLEVPSSFGGLPWAEPPQPADPAAIAAFAPPQTDGATFRFHAVLRDELVHEALDARDLAFVDQATAGRLSVWRLEVNLASSDLRLERMGDAGTEGRWSFYR